MRGAGAVAPDGTAAVTDDRPDWLRRCPPEEPLRDEELVVIARALVILALTVVLGAVWGAWAFWR